MQHFGFEPTLDKWAPHYKGDAIGFGQGGSHIAEPGLLRQVQNFAAHGMAGPFFNLFCNSPSRSFWGCLIAGAG